MKKQNQTMEIESPKNRNAMYDAVQLLCHSVVGLWIINMSYNS
jgi:hypothetical protein